MALEIQNICKKYDNHDALKNISFSLKKGDIVGFLGPNGAGKTTLMKIITSTLKQDSGDVFIFGKNTLKDEITTKNDIGYLAENNPLYNEMKVSEYLDFIACSVFDKNPKLPMRYHFFGSMRLMSALISVLSMSSVSSWLEFRVLSDAFDTHLTSL